MKHWFYILACLLLTFSTKAQNSFGNVWAFGAFAGLDFNSGQPISKHNLILSHEGGSAVLCDRNGNLLLYSTGSKTYTTTSYIGIRKSGTFNFLNETISFFDTTYSNFLEIQPCMFVPQPGKDSIFYLFSTPYFSYMSDGGQYCLVYTAFKVNADKTFSILKKEVQLPGIPGVDILYGGLTGCRHANGKDYWIITATKTFGKFGPFRVGYNLIYAYQLTDTGIRAPIITSLPADSFFLRSWRSIYDLSNLKCSYNGRMLARSSGNTIELLRFDPATGSAVFLQNLNLSTNGQHLLKYTGDQFIANDTIPIFTRNPSMFSAPDELDTTRFQNYCAYGLAFSPNDSLLYVSNNHEGNRPSGVLYVPSLYQFQLHAPNIQNSIYPIPQSLFYRNYIFPGIIRNPPYNLGPNYGMGGLQMGPDGMIYCSRTAQPHLYRIRNPNGVGAACQFDSTDKVSIAPGLATSGLPHYLDALLIPPRFSGCAPLRVSFPNPRPGGLWYDWRFLDDSTFSSSPTPVRTYPRGGQHGVIVRVGLPGGQIDSSFFTVMVYDPPSRLYRYKSDTVCLGATSRFSLDTLGLQNMRFQVLLNGSPLAPDSLWFYHARLATPGTHTVRVIATNTFTQCRDTTDFPLVVRPKPVASLLLQDSLACTPFALPLAVSGSDSAFLLSNRWGRRSLQFSFGSWRDSLLYAAPTCDSLRMVRTNAFGCSDTSALRKFCALAPPQARFSLSDTESCGFVYVRLLDSSRHVFGQPGAYLQWEFGDGSPPLRLNQPSGGSVFHAFQQSGVFNIRLIALNGRCSDTLLLPQTITITPAPQPGIGVQAGLNVDSTFQNGLLRRFVRGCLPLAVSLTDLSSGARDSVRFFLNGQPLSSLNLNFNTPGNAVITQRVFGSTGCITTDTLRVVVTARPQLTSLLLDTLQSCGRQQLRVRATPLNADSLFLNWAVPGANAASILFGSAAFTNLSPTFTQSGIATWTIRMKGGGCEDTVSSGFQVNVRPPAQAALLPTDSLVCVGKIAVLVNQTQFADSLWLGTQPPGGTGFSYQPLSPSVLQPTLSTPGNWRFALVAHSLEGCRDTAFAVVRVLPPLSFSYTYTDSLACGKVFRTLRMQSTDSVQVSQGGSPLAPLSPGRWQFVLTGTDSIRLRVRIANLRCDTLVNLAIPYQVRPLPQLIFRSDSLQACLPFVSQHYILSRNLDSLFWRLSGSWNRLSPLPDSTLLPYNWTLPFSAPYSGELRLRWATVEGCIGDTLVGLVEVKNPPILFASLSPNSGCRPLDALLTLQIAHADTLRWRSDSLSGVRVLPPANLRIPLRFWDNDSLRISASNGLCEADTALPILIRGFSNLPGLRITASRADSLGETERIRIFWNPLPEAKFYRIERSLDSLNWRYLTDVGGDNWTDPLAEVQLPYYYRVTAFDTCGNAAFAFRPIRHLVLSSRWSSSRQESLLLSSSESTADLHLHRRWLGDALLRQDSSLVIAPFNQAFSTLTDGLTHEQTLGFRFLLHHLTQEESGYWRRSNTRMDTLNSLLLLPDAFSPNSDRLNDALRPVGIALQDLTLRVWNRWGQLIYEGQGPQAAWNGQHNQQPVPTGLYLVRLTATDHNGKPMEMVKQVWVK